MASIPDGPLYGWQRITSPDKLADAIAKRTEAIAGDADSAAELAALEAGYCWGRGAGRTTTVFNGFTAASYVAYSTSETVLVIDKRDTAAGLVSTWAQQDRCNTSGTVPSVDSVASGNITSKVLNAASNGDNVSVFASADHVDEIAPSIMQLADASVASVFFISAEAESTMEAATTLRTSDCPLLYAASPQECHDAAVVAVAIARNSNTPVVVFFDATSSGHVLADVVVGTPEWIDRFIGASGEEPGARSTTGSPNRSRRESLDSSATASSSFISGAMLNVSTPNPETEALLFKLMTSLKLDPIQYHGSANVETVIVGFGPGSVAIPSAIHTDQTSVGYLQIRALRPWSTAELVNKIPRSVRNLVILDNSPGRSLYEDIAVSVAEVATKQKLYLAVPAIKTNGFSVGLAGAIINAARHLPDDTMVLNIQEEIAPRFVTTQQSLTQAIFWKISLPHKVLNEAHGLATAVATEALRESRARVAVSKDATSGSICSRTELALSSEAYSPLVLESSLVNVNYVSFGHSSLLLMPNYDLLPVAPGATVIVNCSWSDGDIDIYVPTSLKKKIADLGLRLFSIDADALGRRFGIGADQILQALFWPLCTKLETPSAISSLFEGQLEMVVGELHQVDIPASWNTLPYVAPPPAPRFVSVTEPRAEVDVAPIEMYSTLLTELFGSSSVVSDNTKSETLFGGRYEPSSTADVNSVFADVDGRGEVSLGAQMARFKKREQLVHKVTTYLDSKPADGYVDLQASLSNWYQNKDDSAASRTLGEAVTAQLTAITNLPIELNGILDLAQYFAKPSKWILGGDSWAFDVSYSGIHHIMASKEDINILVFDTTVQSKIPSITRATGKTRKDIGLYAMNYGNTFVASTAASFSRTQAVKALLEADAYKGPSVVLAYTPVVSEEESINSAVEVINAVDSGNWPLYRWDPSKPTTPFELDSAKLRADVEAFVKRDTDLSLIYNNDLADDFEVKASLDSSMIDQQSMLLGSSNASAGESVEKIDMSMTIAFGSDNGNGMSVAERLAKKAEVRGVREVKCIEANTLTVDELKASDVVLFVISTAGQGEMCGNAKTFWTAVSKVKSIPDSVRYSILGLGDSAYWGKGTADSARYFCKPAKDLDQVLTNAGAKKIHEMALGDDQDDNSYEGAASPWITQVLDKLGVHAVAGEDDGKPAALSGEGVKSESNYLRGHILRSLQDTSTGKILPEDAMLTKFHGIYQQDNRDVRASLENNGKERAYAFMIRVGIPGGVCTPKQLIHMLKLADSHANGFLKLTTRQAFQLHGVIKHRLKPTMQIINQGLMDTLAACGDVCRNVIASPMPIDVGTVEAEVLDFARRIQVHLKPQTAAYHEIWLDKKKVGGDANAEVEPLYGPTYLPRKFKIAIAVPPQNDVDVFSHCLGFIAIVVNGKLLGYNITAGGGMGMTHGNTKTFPRLADILGFCTPEQAIEAGTAVMLVQRDFGDRKVRSHARLKYTMEDHGVEWYRAEVEKRCGFKLGAPRPFKFTSNGDRHGWIQGSEGNFHYGIYVENGHVKDTESVKMRTGLEEIAKVHTGDIRLTANQHIIIGNVEASKLSEIASLLQKYNIDNGRYSETRMNSMACVALPTCALAMAESQRYLPTLLTKIEGILEQHGLFKVPIVVRMTGCPNGCARPYMAEIAFVGKAPGAYNMYLGGGFAGNRLTKLYRESVTEPQILEILEPILADYAANRIGEERFGDFVIRRGIVPPCRSGATFHETEKDKCESVETFSGTNDIYW